VDEGAILGVGAENTAVFAIKFRSVNNILLRTAIAHRRLFER